MHWFNSGKIDNKLLCSVFTEIYSKFTPRICVIQRVNTEEKNFKLNLNKQINKNS